jgi:hypothetical protein
VLAIAPADLEAVIAGAPNQAAKEAARLKSIAEGRFDYRPRVAPQRDRMMRGWRLAQTRRTRA